MLAKPSNDGEGTEMTEHSSCGPLSGEAEESGRLLEDSAMQPALPPRWHAIALTAGVWMLCAVGLVHLLLWYARPEPAAKHCDMPTPTKLPTAVPTHQPPLNCVDKGDTGFGRSCSQIASLCNVTRYRAVCPKTCDACPPSTDGYIRTKARTHARERTHGRAATLAMQNLMARIYT